MIKSFKRKWRKILIYFLRLYRVLDFGFSSIKTPKSRQDRMIIKVVSSVLDSPGVKVYYTPVGPKVYIHTKDKRYMIILTRTMVSITNHKFFFSSYLTDQMAESLIRLSLIKVEEEIKKLDVEMRSNENHFLEDIYESFRKKKQTSGHPVSNSLQEALKEML